MYSRGIAICTYNRYHNLNKVIDAVLETKPPGAQVVVCDDGSTDRTPQVVQGYPDIIYVRGPNKGVGANKNRAIYSLQNYDFLCILEDDLYPTAYGWFEMYEKFCLNTNIHHFCRVQDKRVEEAVPDFQTWCVENLKLTPIYGPSPRGDLTFISNVVVRHVGAIHPDFVGVGHAHGQWSDRVNASGLINHPNKWIDIKEASEMFKQVGDTEGGRWMFDEAAVKAQVKRNSDLRKQLGTEPLYIKPFLP